MMNNRIYLIGGIVALVIIILIAWSFFGKDGGMNGGSDLPESEGREGELIDVVSDFYSSWLSAASATSTDPYESGLATDQVLSRAVQAQLEEARNDTDNELDPVLCQATAPNNIGVKSVFEDEERAQMMILPRGGENISPMHAVVTLNAVENGWLITGIECAEGESEPEREFDFDREGKLLKSVQPPLDPQYWHLVFEENGQMGHTAPLFFDEESTCITPDGNESTCDPSQFMETADARVQGSMSEAGVTVKRLELLE